MTASLEVIYLIPGNKGIRKHGQARDGSLATGRVVGSNLIARPNLSNDVNRNTFRPPAGFWGAFIEKPADRYHRPLQIGRIERCIWLRRPEIAGLMAKLSRCFPGGRRPDARGPENVFRGGATKFDWQRILLIIMQHCGSKLDGTSGRNGVLCHLWRRDRSDQWFRRHGHGE